MKIKSLLRIINFLILFTLGVSEIQAQISAIAPDNYLSISSSHFGLNGRSTEGPSWTNSGFLSLVEKMNPGVVRYPAGTQANYWDWRTGTFIEGSGKTSSYTYSISMLAAGLPENTEIIYVMNLARPLPWTGIALDAPEEVLISDSVLQYKITDVLQALNEFEVNGKLPIALELGNEFYFDSEHGAIYAARPYLYLSHSDKIIRAVKEQYPEIKILLITTKGGTSNRDYWNNTVIQYLEDNPDLAELITGLVQHHYINESYGDPTIVFNEASSTIAINDALVYTEQMKVDYSIVPDKFELWFTEMGATKSNADETWVAGLRASLFSLEMAILGNKVNNVLYHHITEQSVIDKDRMKLGASGLSLSLLSEAVEDQSKLAKISFDGQVPMNGDYSSLQAYLFKTDSTENLILMNVGDQNISDINLDTILSNNVFLYGRQLYSLDPWVKGVFEGLGISEDELLTTDNLMLKPFSMSIIKTRIQEPDISSVNLIPATECSVYPNPHSNYFNIRTDNEFSSGDYKIYDIRGKLLKSGILTSGENKVYYSGSKGVYILFLNLDNQRSIIKLVRSTD